MVIWLGFHQSLFLRAIDEKSTMIQLGAVMQHKHFPGPI